MNVNFFELPVKGNRNDNICTIHATGVGTAANRTYLQSQKPTTVTYSDIWLAWLLHHSFQLQPASPYKTSKELVTVQRMARVS